MNEFYTGEYIIYQNGEKYELGRITSLTDDGAFVCYHEGETAAKTSYDYMHKLVNAYAVKATSLGGDRFKDSEKERPTGHWVKVGGYATPGGDPVWQCSECGKGLHVYGVEHGTYGADVSDGQWVSCPNCGVVMSGGKNG